MEQRFAKMLELCCSASERALIGLCETMVGRKSMAIICDDTLFETIQE